MNADNILELIHDCHRAFLLQQVKVERIEISHMLEARLKQQFGSSGGDIVPMDRTILGIPYTPVNKGTLTFIFEEK